MAWAPPGEFILGTDDTDERGEGVQFGFPQPWYEDEHPRQKIFLEGFYIDRYEVTQSDYSNFVRATKRRPPANWRDGAPSPGRERHPVTQVDWYDANDYCQWIGKRLPTEMEWEKGARGTDGRKYPWGEIFEAGRANIATDSGGGLQTKAVGSYPAGKSPYGLFDMIGNVWEWTDSWYLPYPGNAVRNKDFGMKYRVVRGLSYSPIGHIPDEGYRRAVEVYARASARSYEPPTMLLDDVGFRCAKSAK